MTKILYVPLDDRDCNYEFPWLLSKMTEDIELLRPPYEWMGFLKTPAKRDKIWQWIFEQAPFCEYAILSVDTLIYGNIIGSRTHHYTLEECSQTMDLFRQLKRQNPHLHIHAFNLAARVAAYNDSHEDPEYWQNFGYDIWRYTWLLDKQSRFHITAEELQELTDLKEKIPSEILDDFLTRRKTNRLVNLTSVELVKENIFDILTVPKDDTAEYGYAALDQIAIMDKTQKENLTDRVYCYPGADEAGSMIFARVFGLIKHHSPVFYVRYSSLSGSNVVPLYEDRPLGESIKWQIFSAGGICTETPTDATCMLAVNAPGKQQIESGDQKTGRIFASDNAANPEELLRYIHFFRKQYDKPVGISDVTMANGCDNIFMERARCHKIFDEITVLGGWNTAENTNGVVIAVLSIASYYQNWKEYPVLRKEADTFLLRALIADWLCQANVLQDFVSDYAPAHQINPYFLEEHTDEATDYFITNLRQLVLDKLDNRLKEQPVFLENIRFNWNGAYYFAIDAKIGS